jgi:hypothetical protein
MKIIDELTNWCIHKSRIQRQSGSCVDFAERKGWRMAAIDSTRVQFVWDCVSGEEIKYSEGQRFCESGEFGREDDDDTN